MDSIKFSVIIPVYKNEGSITKLLCALDLMREKLSANLEVVFVVDGSPDRSYELLRNALPALKYQAQLLLHSRNFGSFAAIRSGLAAARGDYYGIMAADLQEPPELLIQFFNSLESDECDVAIGTRIGRDDPLFSRVASGIFWGLYRRLVVNDMPAGGVDVFGCNRIFKENLLQLDESRSSLIALIFWLGFRRKLVSYTRLAREDGASAWSFAKKVDYMMDSIFSFTDYPIRMLLRIGFLGILISLFAGCLVLVSNILGYINVPGYAATMLVVLFFGALNLFAVGVVGIYAWRGYENTKRRPISVIMSKILK